MMRGAAILIALTGLLASVVPARAEPSLLGRLRGAIDGAISDAQAAGTQRRLAARAVRDLMGESVRGALERSQDPVYFEADAPLPLPGPLASKQARLRQFGASEPLDALQEDLRLAAAAAALAAAPLLIAEAEQVELGDPLGLLADQPGAAATHLWVRTEGALADPARKAARAALVESDAAALLDRLGESRLAESLRASAENALVDHVVAHALSSLHAAMKEEERAIRADPARRTTPALVAALGRPV